MGWRSVGRPRGLHGCSMDARYRDDGLAPLVDGLTGVVLARITASPVEYIDVASEPGWVQRRRDRIVLEDRDQLEARELNGG